MTKLDAAINEYLRRVDVANSKERGADHIRILDEVAREYDVDYTAISEATLDAMFAKPN